MSAPEGERLELGLPSGVLLGKEAWHYQEVGSTNDVCKELASEGAEEGLCVVADGQSLGRGRMGRSWVSPPGVGLYFSCLLRPEAPAESLPLFTLLAGGAAARALVEATGAEVGLKWPNDLILEEKKLGGILSELVTSPGGAPAVVVGIGLNVTTAPEDFPPEVRRTATSLLQATGRTYERHALLKAVLMELDKAYSAFRERGPGAALEAWRPFASTLGRRVRVERAEEPLEGEAVGLTEKGHLVVRTDQGQEVEVMAGEVVHLQSG